MSIKKRILEILSDGQPHSPKELIPITHRFSAAIHSLREDGYTIETVPIAHNQCVYKLLKQKQESV